MPSVTEATLIVCLHVFKLVRLCCGGAHASPETAAAVKNGGFLCG